MEHQVNRFMGCDYNIVTLPKCVFVLSREEFIQALRRGKRWRRREALRARQPEARPQQNTSS